MTRDGERWDGRELTGGWEEMSSAEELMSMGLFDVEPGIEDPFVLLVSPLTWDELATPENIENEEQGEEWSDAGVAAVVEDVAEVVVVLMGVVLVVVNIEDVVGSEGLPSGLGVGLLVIEGLLVVEGFVAVGSFGDWTGGLFVVVLMDSFVDIDGL